jgi:putative phosphoesterase
MKIGVLSDIHGNHYALKEVLNDARLENVNRLIILGDLVGYYYYPNLVLDLISEWGFDIIKGNHEEILFNILDHPKSIELINNKYGTGHQCAIDKLNDIQLNFLRSLPETKSIIINGVSILMTHGSPWSKDLYIYPDADKEIVKKFDNFNYDFILFGHTHYACSFKTANGFALNPGSVGQSRQNGGKAYWSIIDTINKSYQFKITDYDATALKKEILEKDPKSRYNYDILERKTMDKS